MPRFDPVLSGRAIDPTRDRRFFEKPATLLLLLESNLTGQHAYLIFVLEAM
jgi:hypothetical protein